MTERRWLVDGMNVIGSRPTGWWRDRQGAMRDLIEQLSELARRAGQPVTVVLDSKPFELAPPNEVAVVFACRGGSQAADDEIVEMVERDADPVSLSVVTSDKELAARVEDLGATVVSAGAFRDRLDASAAI